MLEGTNDRRLHGRRQNARRRPPKSGPKSGRKTPKRVRPLPNHPNVAGNIVFQKQHIKNYLIFLSRRRTRSAQHPHSPFPLARPATLNLTRPRPSKAEVCAMDRLTVYCQIKKSVGRVASEQVFAFNAHSDIELTEGESPSRPPSSDVSGRDRRLSESSALTRATPKLTMITTVATTSWMA